MRRYYLKSKDDKKYIARNKFHPDVLYITYNSLEKMTYEEKDKDKLINISKSLPKTIQNLGEFYLTYEETDGELLKKSNEYEFISEDTKQKITILTNTFKEINADFESLSIELSNQDKAIQDILHYIEFNNFSASKGYALAKEIQKIRNKRRKIKIKLDILSEIKSQDVKGFINGNIFDNIKKIYEYNQNKKYKPKIYTDLFNK